MVLTSVRNVLEGMNFHQPQFCRVWWNAVQSADSLEISIWLGLLGKDLPVAKWYLPVSA